jgi:hypothetical protein
MKLQIDLHADDWKLLEEMATANYRDPRQQAAWLVSCAVASWATYEASEPSSDKDAIHEPV